MDGLLGYILAKGYVNQTLTGMGALVGSACQIKSITSVKGGNNIVFTWKDNTGVSHDSVPMFVADGKSAYETWLESGNIGTENDFLNSLKNNVIFKEGTGIRFTTDPVTKEITISATGTATSEIPITEQLQPNEIAGEDDFILLF